MTTVRRGARSPSNVEELYQDWNGSPVLTPTKPGRRSTQVGMSMSLGGTQRSGEAASHSQEANIAEVSHGKPVLGEPESPHPTHGTTRR